MRITVQEILSATGGKLLSGDANASFASYAIDSRKVRTGDLFFAMKGSETDGHYFAADAFSGGAAGLVVEHPVELPAGEPIVVQVNDSLLALQQLAGSVRINNSALFVGITGSSGKTSCKEFAAALLAQQYTVYKNEGNLNSITGLPLALLALRDQRAAVLEVGINQPGEMAAIASVLRPDVAMFLNVNPVHLGMYDSIETIADEKSILLRHVPPEGSIVYNADDRRVRARVEQSGDRKKIGYGLSREASVRVADVTHLGVRGMDFALLHGRERIPVRTPLCGLGSVYNIAAAAATALVLGLTGTQVREGIAGLQPYRQRGVLKNADGITIYDDSYNSNPRAVELALEVIERSQGFRRKVAILGDMFELGPDEVRFHREAGERAAACGIDVLITAGALSHHVAEAARRAGIKEVHSTPDSAAAADIAAHILRDGDLVLIKGSRGTKMEVVVERLTSDR